MVLDGGGVTGAGGLDLRVEGAEVDEERGLCGLTPRGAVAGMGACQSVPWRW